MKKRLCAIGSKIYKSSILVQIRQNKYRALIDSGADISTISRKVCEQTYNVEQFRQTKINIGSANGTKIIVAGEVDLEIEVGKSYVTQAFLVTENLTQNIILGFPTTK